MASHDDDPSSAATLVAGTQVTGGAPPAATAPAPAPASVIAGRYEILGLLGAGGMGRVYRAHDRALDELVALKTLRRELVDNQAALERFRQEVKLARRVTSPHVVRTFDLGEHAGEHFLTMEYIDGRSLAQVIEDGPLATDEVVRIARGIAAGIAAAHGNGVLHRDLKPDNVLVGKTGRIAITDFGIACAVASPVATGDRFAGTPAYMAPEQVESGRDIGPATDVYALGAIVYEMLAGRRPFPGTDPIQVAVARLREPPPDVRALRPVPAAIAELALRCMARAPGDRFADGAAVVQALGALHDLGTPTQPPKPLQATPTRTSRSIAILPLRASGELAEIADGLGEEIVDALSMTRELRVRPLASVKKAAVGDFDAREVGRTLGVDVVVDGSLRKRGPQVRLAARAIGVADDFQLWASHFDSPADSLFEASDQLVQAIARALTVDLELPPRAALDPRAAEIYLEAKAKLRARWIVPPFTDIVAMLERARAIAPDDPGVLAMLATALARQAFYGDEERRLPEARQLAERAIELAPSSGEAHVALACACLYAGATPDAARALVHSLLVAPGIAAAQALLGALLLEAGEPDLALAHLEAARSLDPGGLSHIDLPRAYIYANRWDDAMREYDLALAIPSAVSRLFDELTRGRFYMWRGELYTPRVPMRADVPAHSAVYFRVAWNVHTTGLFPPAARAEMTHEIVTASPRMRASRSQFMTEFLLFVGAVDEAQTWLEYSVAHGLQDHMWMSACPMLAPLRSRPTFAPLAEQVAARAKAVMAAVLGAEQ